jgi:hypothetical protein
MSFFSLPICIGELISYNIPIYNQYYYIFNMNCFVTLHSAADRISDIGYRLTLQLHLNPNVRCMHNLLRLEDAGVDTRSRKDSLPKLLILW